MSVAMNLPFSQEQFYEVFTAYNLAVWPAGFVLALLAAALAVAAVRFPERAGRPVAFGLAFLWTWIALAYHLAFFWSINPAAPLFAAISLGSAGVFAWAGIKDGLQFERALSGRVYAGLAVIIFALVIYPVIGNVLGHRYPAAPTFGLPCPTTIFTFGMLLMASPRFSKAMVVGPLVWAVIGSTAAFALDVLQDLGLVLVAGMGLHMLFRRVPSSGRSPTGQRDVS